MIGLDSNNYLWLLGSSYWVSHRFKLLFIIEKSLSFKIMAVMAFRNVPNPNTSKFLNLVSITIMERKYKFVFQSLITKKCKLILSYP